MHLVVGIVQIDRPMYAFRVILLIRRDATNAYLTVWLLNGYTYKPGMGCRDVMPASAKGIWNLPPPVFSKIIISRRL